MRAMSCEREFDFISSSIHQSCLNETFLVLVIYSIVTYLSLNKTCLLFTLPPVSITINDRRPPPLFGFQALNTVSFSTTATFYMSIWYLNCPYYKSYSCDPCTGQFSDLVCPTKSIAPQIFKLRFWLQECIFFVNPFLCFFFATSLLFSFN
jgi:hypothetical protein